MLIKAKANIPEIVLGVFLTVAIFAMGMVFESSQKPSGANQQITAAKTTEGEQAKSPDSELAGSPWLTKDAAGFFTFVLVLVGAFQVGLFWVQLRLIRESLTDAKSAAKAAERAAKATEDAVELSRQTAERQLRAYVIASACDVDRRGPEGAALVVVGTTIKNTGQTPAHDLKVVSRTDVLEHPIRMPFDFTLISGPDPSRDVLGAGERTGSESVAERPFTGDEMMRAQDPEGGFRIYTWGCVTYRDVFGGERYTNFCSSLIFVDGEAIAHASEHHNDAS
jgi:hypothetical protein